MSNVYNRILEPKIINDEFEGKHAVINMPDMRTMLECIYENKLFFDRVGEAGSSREIWKTYSRSRKFKTSARNWQNIRYRYKSIQKIAL